MCRISPRIGVIHFPAMEDKVCPALAGVIPTKAVHITEAGAKIRCVSVCLCVRAYMCTLIMLFLLNFSCVLFHVDLACH